MRSRSYLAYAEALLVTLLWSSSFVLVKFGLSELPPFFFATVRYTIAFTVLTTVYMVSGGIPRGRVKTELRGVGRGPLLVAGLCGYTLAQGLQFVGLFYLPAVTTSFLLNFTPVFVLLLSIALLEEKATLLQLLGLGVALLGAYAFFSGRLSGFEQHLGVVVVLISGLAWAIYLIVVRKIQRANSSSSLKLTTVTMGIGTAGLMLIAGVVDGPRPISWTAVSIILWLSVVNTAFAFFLWNHALRSIRAYELSVLQNTMLVQIAVLAWIFLGEHLTYAMGLGVALVIVGILLVQVPAARRQSP